MSHSASLHVEQAVVGGLLADPRRIPEVIAQVGPDHFEHKALALVFGAIIALDSAGRPIDTLTVAEQLQADGNLNDAGGLAYLAELDTAAPTAANVVEYARLVLEHSQRRRFVARLDPLVGAARKEQVAVEELLASAHQALESIGSGPSSSGLVQIAQPIDQCLDMLDRHRSAGGGPTGLATGFSDLDRMLTGFHPGELIILAARPGVGKTSLALQWASHVALTERKPVAVFSLEMPQEQLALRLLAGTGDVELKRLREGGLSDHDMTKINTAAADLYAAPMFIDDTGGITLLDMHARARALKQSKGLALLVVDYLQLMGAARTNDNEEQAVAKNSRGLKQLAKKLGVPIVALAQLNRKVEDRKGGRPQLSDLRSSGSIEQDADVVLFIHPQDEEWDRDGDEEVSPGLQPVDLIVAKQRNGPTGVVPLLMKRAQTIFVSPERRYDLGRAA